MDEALKTKMRRGHEFYVKYLSGNVIDIGAGKDLVSPTAERFDLDDGDANFISRYREAESYDTVHSSHCLEHMHEPMLALIQWWSLVRRGGYLVLVVPDEDLYEQGIWPSLFNDDHKNTFTLKSWPSWSPVSHNILELVKNLPNAEIVICETHDDNYNYNLINKNNFKRYKLKRIVDIIRKILNRIPVVGKPLIISFENFLFKYINYPIDQTMRNALAQIQIIAQKK